MVDGRNRWTMKQKSKTRKRFWVSVDNQFRMRLLDQGEKGKIDMDWVYEWIKATAKNKQGQNEPTNTYMGLLT